MSRGAAGRLVQAEALWSIRGRDGFPAAKDEEAWRQVVLFSEHTWGASDSVSNPDGEGPRAQWEYKKAFAERAEKMSHELLAGAAVGAAGLIAERGRQAIDVVNTCSWPRTDLVLVARALCQIGDRVEDETGAPVPSQRLRTGELAFVAKDVPGLGARRYFVGAGHADTMKPGRAVGNEVRNGTMRAIVDGMSGAVRSLVWTSAGTGRELVDAAKLPGLGHYLYVPGVDPGKAVSVSNAELRVSERGPVVNSIVLRSDAPGAKGLLREYRFVEGLDRLDVAVTLDKEKVREKEGVHIAFPFAVPGGAARVDVGWASVRPEADQIEGACRDFFGARDSVDFSNGEFGVTWTSLDAPLVEIGALTDETPRTSERRVWLRKLEPSTTLFSYAMNNYWHTNYTADQEGPVILRYAVSPHLGSDPATAKRRGLEAATPLVAVAADPAAPTPRFPLTIEPGSIIATSLRPTADGQAWILRLYNASARPETLKLSGEAADRGRVFLSDVDGAEGPSLPASLEVPPSGILTLRIIR